MGGWGGSGHHLSVGMPSLERGAGERSQGRGESPSLYVRLEMLAGCLSLFPLDFPHGQSQRFAHGQVCLAAEETCSPDLVPGGVQD